MSTSTPIPPAGGAGSISSLVLGTGNSIDAAGILSNGVFQVNFPVGTVPSSLELPGTIDHETACISLYGPTAQGPLSTALAQFRNNSAGTPTYLGGLFWEYAGGAGANTAGAEYTQFGCDVQANGASVGGLRISSVNGVPGIAQLEAPACTIAHPGFAFQLDPSTGFSLIVGLGTTSDDVVVSMNNGSAVGAERYRFGQDAAGGFFFKITGSSALGAYITIGPNADGIFYDTAQGGIYIDAVASSVAIGLPNARATNTTSGFLALPSCAGTPTGNPANVTLGKVCFIADTTASKLWGNFGGTWKSVALT